MEVFGPRVMGVRRDAQNVIDRHRTGLLESMLNRSHDGGNPIAVVGTKCVSEQTIAIDETSIDHRHGGVGCLCHVGDPHADDSPLIDFGLTGLDDSIVDVGGNGPRHADECRNRKERC